MSKEIMEKLERAIINGNSEDAVKAAQEVVASKIDPLDAIKNGFAKGMDIVGRKFQNFEIFLPEVVLAADAMKAGMGILKPHLSKESLSKASRGRVVIGTCRGDIHDIGKNLVAVMLEAQGFEVLDLGSDVSATKFIEAAKQFNATMIAMSSLMVTSMYYQQEVMAYLKDMGEKSKYLVIVGGGPVTPGWTKEIGADGYGKYADQAVEVAKTLVEHGKEVARPVVRE